MCHCYGQKFCNSVLYLKQRRDLVTINQFHSVIGCASTMPLCIMIAIVCLLSVHSRQICDCSK